MTKRLARVRIEVLLYVLLAVVAAWLRLAKLDWPPLNDVEAAQALTALQGTSDAAPLWGEVDAEPSTSSSYQVLTRLIFQLIGPSDAAARIIPALIGLALVFIPLLLRRRLGMGRALATAWLLGLSPTFIAASRTASGTTLAAFGLLAAVGVALSPDIKARGIWIALALGLTLASGAEAIMALIGLSVAAVVARLQESGIGPVEPTEDTKPDSPRMLWLVPLVAVAIAGGFGLYLKGISGLFDSLASWVTGWTNPSGVSQLTVWAMLLFYEPLILMLGIGGAVLAWRRQDTWGYAALSWAAVAMVLASFYPARQPSDVVWAVIPLILLAGDALARLVEQWAETRAGVAVAGLAAMILVVVIYGYLQLAGYSTGYYINPESAQMIFLFVVAAVALLASGILLFGLGWSWGLAWRGASATAFILLLALSISAGYQLAFSPSAASGRELWRPQSSTIGTLLLVDTLQSLSVAQTGRVEYLEMEVSPDITPGLIWALRDFGQAKVMDRFGEVSSSVVLVPEYAAVPGLTDDFVGQVIVVAERWGWIGALPADLATWWIRRAAPALGERWLLFVQPEAFGLEDLELRGGFE
jgi:hypothetical protein